MLTNFIALIERPMRPLENGCVAFGHIKRIVSYRKPHEFVGFKYVLARHHGDALLPSKPRYLPRCTVFIESKLDDIYFTGKHFSEGNKIF